MKTLAAFGLEHNIPAMKADLQRYLINYDVWFFEEEAPVPASVPVLIQASAPRAARSQVQVLVQGSVRAPRPVQALGQILRLVPVLGLIRVQISVLQLRR